MRARILILEDDFLVAKGLTRLIESMGFEVLGPFARVADAEQATGVDLAILDVNLRGQTSLPLAAALVDAGARVIFVTGYSKMPHLPEALRDVPTLHKPFHHAGLERLVHQLLETPPHGT